MTFATEDPAGASPSKAGVWVALLRAAIAVGLGLALLLYPDKSRSALISIIGIFWILGGLVSLRWDSNGKRPGRLSLGTSLILVGAGILVVLLVRLGTSVGEVVLIYLLALAMMLTGAVHTFFGFRTRSHPQRRWSASSFILGFFEIILGAVLLFAPLSLGPVLYTIAGIWALAGAVMLLVDAFAMKKRE